jgi:hypothetical protein
MLTSARSVKSISALFSTVGQASKAAAAAAQHLPSRARTFSKVDTRVEVRSCGMGCLCMGCLFVGVLSCVFVFVSMCACLFILCV